jgi:hypothetical protein
MRIDEDAPMTARDGKASSQCSLAGERVRGREALVYDAFFVAL